MQMVLLTFGRIGITYFLSLLSLCANTVTNFGPLQLHLGHRNDMFVNFSLSLSLPLHIVAELLTKTAADCTPYLLNLGLTKSNTALVWIAGPLSGICVQPIVGVIADESKSRWGRRRPFMILGAFIVAICLLVLGFTREVVGLVFTDDESARRPTIVLAVLSIYAVDFAINAGT